MNQSVGPLPNAMEVHWVYVPYWGWVRSCVWTPWAGPVWSLLGWVDQGRCHPSHRGTSHCASPPSVADVRVWGERVSRGMWRGTRSCGLNRTTSTVQAVYDTSTERERLGKFMGHPGLAWKMKFRRTISQMVSMNPVYKTKYETEHNIIKIPVLLSPFLL